MTPSSRSTAESLSASAPTGIPTSAATTVASIILAFIPCLLRVPASPPGSLLFDAHSVGHSRSQAKSDLGPRTDRRSRCRLAGSLAEKAVALGPQGGLGPIVDPNAPKDVREVDLDSLLAYLQAPRYLLVGKPEADEHENLSLARAELFGRALGLAG